MFRIFADLVNDNLLNKAKEEKKKVETNIRCDYDNLKGTFNISIEKFKNSYLREFLRRFESREINNNNGIEVYFHDKHLIDIREQIEFLHNLSKNDDIKYLFVDLTIEVDIIKIIQSLREKIEEKSIDKFKKAFILKYDVVNDVVKLIPIITNPDKNEIVEHFRCIVDYLKLNYFIKIKEE